MSLNISLFKVNDTSAYLTGVDISLNSNKDSQQPASCKSVNEKLTELLSDIKQVEISEEGMHYYDLSGSVGDTITIQIKENTNYRRYRTDCSAGDVLTYKSRTTSTDEHSPAVILDADNKILWKNTVYNSSAERTVTVPQNGVLFVMNANKNYDRYLFILKYNSLTAQIQQESQTRQQGDTNIFNQLQQEIQRSKKEDIFAVDTFSECVAEDTKVQYIDDSIFNGVESVGYACCLYTKKADKSICFNKVYGGKIKGAWIPQVVNYKLYLSDGSMANDSKREAPAGSPTEHAYTLIQEGSFAIDKFRERNIDIKIDNNTICPEGYQVILYLFSASAIYIEWSGWNAITGNSAETSNLIVFGRGSDYSDFSTITWTISTMYNEGLNTGYFCKGLDLVQEKYTTKQSDFEDLVKSVDGNKVVYSVEDSFEGQFFQGYEHLLYTDPATYDLLFDRIVLQKQKSGWHAGNTVNYKIVKSTYCVGERNRPVNTISNYDNRFKTVIATGSYVLKGSDDTLGLYDINIDFAERMILKKGEQLFILLNSASDIYIEGNGYNGGVGNESKTSHVFLDLDTGETWDNLSAVWNTLNYNEEQNTGYFVYAPKLMLRQRYATVESVEELSEEVDGKVDTPSQSGQPGQALINDGLGGIIWGNVETDPQDIADAVEAWITAHPEAVSTVLDNSISYQKLTSSMKNNVGVNVDDYESLKVGNIWTAAIQAAIGAAGTGGVVKFGANKTYEIDECISLIDGQTIVGNNATLKRCNEVVAHVVNEVTSSNTFEVDVVPSNWKIDSRLVIFTGNTKDDVVNGDYIITAIDGNLITMSGTYSSIPANASVVVAWTMMGNSQRPLPVVGCKVFNLNFEGNKSNNKSTYYWYKSGTLGIFGYGTIISGCKFFNIPNENITTHGGIVMNCYGENLNGSFVHLSCPSEDLLGGERYMGTFVVNNIVKGANIISHNVTGHSKAVVEQSWNPGKLIVANNQFYGSGLCVCFAMAPSTPSTEETSSYTGQTGYIIVSNNIYENFSAISDKPYNNWHIDNKLMTNNIFRNCGTTDFTLLYDVDILIDNNLFVGSTVVKTNGNTRMYRVDTEISSTPSASDLTTKYSRLPIGGEVYITQIDKLYKKIKTSENTIVWLNINTTILS